MKRRKIFYIVGVLSFLVYYALKHLQFPLNPWIRNYFADFLCLFLINASVEYVISFYKKRRVKISYAQVGFSLIVCSFLFEYYLPHQNPEKYTGDFLDLVMYLLGAIMFLVWNGSIKVFGNKP